MVSSVLAVMGLVVLLQQGGLNLVGFLTPLALSFALIYFFMIVPQRNQQRQLQAMRDKLQVGDSVVTTGGIYGTITRVHDNKLTVQLRVAKNPPVKINITRYAIVGLADPPEEE